MASARFQFIFSTAKFRATVAFYREGLALPVLEEWDRGPFDRGAIFRAASGAIVVTALPKSSRYTLGTPDPPKGVSIGFEVEDVDGRYRLAREKRLPISQELTTFDWGERGFSVTDPNGIGAYIFSTNC